MSTISDKLGLQKRELVDRIREERDRQKITLRALSDRLGAAPSYLSNVETGAKIPTLDQLIRIAEELGLRVDVDCVKPRKRA